MARYVVFLSITGARPNSIYVFCCFSLACLTKKKKTRDVGWWNDGRWREWSIRDQRSRFSTLQAPQTFSTHSADTLLQCKATSTLGFPTLHEVKQTQTAHQNNKTNKSHLPMWCALSPSSLIFFISYGACIIPICILLWPANETIIPLHCTPPATNHSPRSPLSYQLTRKKFILHQRLFTFTMLDRVPDVLILTYMCFFFFSLLISK